MNWLESIASLTGLGASTGFGFYMIKWLVEYFGGRMDKRTAALDAGTDRLMKLLEARVDELTKRVSTVERELAECQSKHAESEAKAARLEALISLTMPGMRANFPIDPQMPNDIAVMAAKLEGTGE
jgi:hypothetical protein